MKIFIFVPNENKYINMCGIVGYIGKRQAWPVLVEGLRKLEYRGYDSARRFGTGCRR